MFKVAWRKYQGALLPILPPHGVLKQKSFFIFLEVIKNFSIFARWTSDFDCDKETEFWYVIKDEFLSLEMLDSKNRYQIKRGLNNCKVRIVTAEFIAENGYSVYKKAFGRYSGNSLPISRDLYESSIINSVDCGREVSQFWGVFDGESELLIGYSHNIINDDIVCYSTVKFDPDSIGIYPSYALFYRMNEFYLGSGLFRYVSDGARSISHETDIQWHLIKKHGFRRAYCRLNVIYHPVVWLAVKILMPFKGRIEKSCSPLLGRVLSVLNQEEIRRSFY